MNLVAIPPVSSKMRNSDTNFFGHHSMFSSPVYSIRKKEYIQVPGNSAINSDYYSEFDFSKVKDYSEREIKRKQIYSRMAKLTISLKKDLQNSFSDNNVNRKLHLKSLQMNQTDFASPKNFKSVSCKSSILKSKKTAAINYKYPLFTDYFTNVINKCKKKSNKMTVKSLDPSQNLFLTVRSDAENVYMTHNSIHNSTSSSISSPVRKLKLKETKLKTQLNIRIENFDYNNTQSIIPEEDRGRNRIDKPMRDLKNLKDRIIGNKKVVDHNNNLKILCYKTPMELSVKDILISTADSLKVTLNQMKHKNIKSEDNFNRVKQLPPIVETFNFTTGKLSKFNKL